MISEFSLIHLEAGVTDEKNWLCVHSSRKMMTTWGAHYFIFFCICIIKENLNLFFKEPMLTFLYTFAKKFRNYSHQIHWICFNLYLTCPLQDT